MESTTALKLLAEEIDNLKTKCYSNLRTIDWMLEAWHPGSKLSTFKATSALFCLVLGLALLAESSVENLICGLIIILLAVLNLAVTGLDSFLRKEEIYRRTDRFVCNIIKKVIHPLCFQAKL